MRVFLEAGGEPLSGRMPVDQEFVAVNPRSASPWRAGDACEVRAAGSGGVHLANPLGVILGSDPEIRGGRLYETFKSCRHFLDGLDPASRLIRIRRRNGKGLRSETFPIAYVTGRAADDDAGYS